MTTTTAHVARWRLLGWLGIVLAAVSLGAPFAGAQSEERVYVVEISGTIDQGLAPYLQRVLDQAEGDGSAVLLHVDTPGGRLDAVLEMRRALLASDVRTVAFVDPDALSAGALVTIASDEIYVAPGAVIGAATPVVGGSGETADEKTISAVAGIFRSTAEAQGRAPEVAEAMVDPAVVIEGLVAEGELLTLSDTEALEAGYADAQAADIGAALAEAGLEDAEVVETSTSPAEILVRWLTNPVVASLLLTVGIWLVIGDVLTGGIGAGLVAGIVLIGLFLWGHRLAGLAGWEDVALVVLGLALIALEVLVIPGTGVAGVLGLASLLGGAYLAMLNRDVATGAQIETAVTVVSASFLLIVAGVVGMIAFVSRGGGPRGLVLTDRLGERPPSRTGWLAWLPDRDDASGAGDDAPAARVDSPTAARVDSTLVGATGRALTDLRPSGMAEIDGQRVDVVTEGDYIASGEPVEVVADHGYRRVVRSPTGAR